MSSGWADWREPSYVPNESFLLCGADPCWSPAREAQRAYVTHSADPRRCRECGSVIVDPATGTGTSAAALMGDQDPLRTYAVSVKSHGTGGHHRMRRDALTADKLVVVCGGCNRSRYDGTHALERTDRGSAHETEGTDKGDRRYRCAEAVKQSMRRRGG